MVPSLSVCVVHRSRFFSQWHRTPSRPAGGETALPDAAAAPPSRLQAPPSPSPHRSQQHLPASPRRGSTSLPFFLSVWRGGAFREVPPRLLGGGRGRNRGERRPGRLHAPSPAGPWKGAAMGSARRLFARGESRWASGTTFNTPTHPTPTARVSNSEALGVFQWHYNEREGRTADSEIHNQSKRHGRLSPRRPRALLFLLLLRLWPN